LHITRYASGLIHYGVGNVAWTRSDAVGSTGSFVGTTSSNVCGPPIPCVIVKATLTVVSSPGWMVV
jgi:hypothetical protein